MTFFVVELGLVGDAGVEASLEIVLIQAKYTGRPDI